jgi:WD40 repeat protein/predicted Ser/Thr protein kinase
MPELSPAAVEVLFQQAADLPPQRRAAFLDEQCNGNAELRFAVEELLDFDAKAQGDPDFLQSPAAGIRATLPLSTAVPASFGRYRILRICGEGGMGVVYEAEQDNPRRTVALKVISPGLVSLEHAKRFNHEAQILGRLQHPGIAQVYDAGFVEDGRPYFAMEFIRGMPLDAYARNRHLDASQRLELMARVCDAVQHAHDRGVIHRDLKPANILVDAAGQPKVVDFGVAHVAAADVLRTVSRTHTGELLGTLSYMSPEQIAADPSGLDARSDVYALGVILFELLADRLPYRLEQLPVHEVARVIREQEPSRLGSVDAHFRGDVEIIAAKALEKDKTRRYAAAGDLASDLRHFLRGEAIVARPPSAVYQLQKFARRHKALVGGALGVVAALVLGLIGTIIFAVEAGRNAETARDKEHEARYQTYRARIAAASAALGNHDVSDAARQLDEAPEELRGWEWRHLHSRLDDSSAVFQLKPHEISQLVQTSEGMRVAGFLGGTVRLLDLDGREVLSRTLPPLPQVRVAFDLLAGGQPRFAHAQENAVLVLNGRGSVGLHMKGVPSLEPTPGAFSRDGSRLAVCWTSAKDWAVTFYRLQDGDRSMVRVNPECFTSSVAFSRDNSCVVTAGEDGVTRVWDSTTGAKRAECRGHRSKVLRVAFRPDGRRFLTTSADGSVRQWDPATGREVEAAYERQTGEIMSAAYSPDGQWIASGGTDRTVRLWRADDRQERAVFHGHTAFVKEVAFTADGSKIISTSTSFGSQGFDGDGTVRVWDATLGEGLPVLRGHTSYVYPVAYSLDGWWIASGSWDHTVRLWDAQTGEPCATFQHPGVVRALAFSPDSVVSQRLR